MRIGVIMDEIETLHFSKDSTLAILFAAAKRDYTIFYIQQKDLCLVKGEVCATMQRLHLFPDKMLWFHCDEAIVQPLNTLNATLMRKDPPVDMDYIYATQLLDLAVKQGEKVFNHPTALRRFNEKIFATWFPHCCPPTVITADAPLIKAFLKEQQEIVLKPLNGMGGQGIFRIQSNESNLNVIIETLTNYGQHAIMAQRYLPEIAAGDKRVLLVDGIPMDYALARIPRAGETRGNLAAGGKAVAMPLSQREHFICEQIAPVLKEQGLLFVGVDIIGDYLTEINITSPTCICELEQQTPLKISEKLLDVLEAL